MQRHGHVHDAAIDSMLFVEGKNGCGVLARLPCHVTMHGGGGGDNG